MKKLILALLVAVASFTAQAQQKPAAKPQPAHQEAAKPDVIVKRNGEKIEGRVKNLTQTEIFYGLPDMPDNIFRSVQISDVAAILYSDGKVQTFEQAAPLPAPVPQNALGQPQEQPLPSTAPAQAPPTQYLNAPAQAQQPPMPAPAPALSPAAAYQKGYSEAGLYYHRYGGARVGALVSTIFLGPLFGLIPAIAVSATPPSGQRLDIPVGAGIADPGYMVGYKDGAKKIKSRKTWGGYGIGCAISVGLVLILTAGR